MGKHDVRAWKGDIFLQIECKKTMQSSDSLSIQKKWLDKINFDNDEILCFSFNGLRSHFCFLPKRVGLGLFKDAQINYSKEIYKPVGGSGFGFKREWLENKERYCFQVEFNKIIYYVIDLEIYLENREKYNNGGNLESKGFVEQVKAIHDATKLKKLYHENESKLTTREKRIFYGKLERVENGKFNAVEASVMNESQFWIDNNKPALKSDAVDKVLAKIEQWVDLNLMEDDDGNIFWGHKVEVDVLKKIIKKILGAK